MHALESQTNSHGGGSSEGGGGSNSRTNRTTKIRTIINAAQDAYMVPSPAVQFPHAGIDLPSTSGLAILHSSRSQMTRTESGTQAGRAGQDFTGLPLE